MRRYRIKTGTIAASANETISFGLNVKVLTVMTYSAANDYDLILAVDSNMVGAVRHRNNLDYKNGLRSYEFTYNMIMYELYVENQSPQDLDYLIMCEEYI